jgi:hypothetical protein
MYFFLKIWYFTSLQDQLLSGVNVAPALHVRATAMFFLITEEFQVVRSGGLQWHNAHTKFR